jgi:hypothetical protein
MKVIIMEKQEVPLILIRNSIIFVRIRLSVYCPATVHHQLRQFLRIESSRPIAHVKCMISMGHDMTSTEAFDFL